MPSPIPVTNVSFPSNVTIVQANRYVAFLDEYYFGEKGRGCFRAFIHELAEMSSHRSVDEVLRACVCSYEAVFNENRLQIPPQFIGDIEASGDWGVDNRSFFWRLSNTLKLQPLEKYCEVP